MNFLIYAITLLAMNLLCLTRSDSVSDTRIPKMIHYVWVGTSPKSELVHKCLASWRKFAKDWIIVEWNDDTIVQLDVPYVKEAYESKRYAFVSDYLRLYLVYTYGGVYLDSDVELLAPLDQFMNHTFFLAAEFIGNSGAHLFGGVKGNPLLGSLLQELSTLHFRKQFGFYNDWVLPKRMDRAIRNLYNVTWKAGSDSIVNLGNDSYMYPSHYFCTPKEGKPAFAHHHYSGTWYGDKLIQYKRMATCIERCQNPKPLNAITGLLYRLSMDTWSNFETVMVLLSPSFIFLLLIYCFRKCKWKTPFISLSKPRSLLK